MVDVHTNIVGRNLDLDVIGKNGNDLYAGEGGLAALLGIRGADAHQTRMVDVHTNIVGRNLDLDVIGKNGNDLYAGEGGLAALLGIRGADAHQAVHTGLSGASWHPWG